MNPQELQEFNKMKADLDTLIKWKQQKTAQQISYPLDYNSVTILNKYFLSIVSNLDFTSSSGQLFPNILVRQDGKVYLISVDESLILFTVNTGTDVVTLGANITTGGQGTFADGDQVLVNSTGDLPSPLVDSFPYTVVQSTGTTIKLSTPVGSFSWTGALSVGATTGTLTGNWAAASGTYVINFANGDWRTGTFTNGNAGVSWSGGLSSGAGTPLTVYTIVNITTNGTGQQYIHFFN